jgi:hypothetical protein
MRHLIHVTRTASGVKELEVAGATTVVRYRALERLIPDELEERTERGEAVDHLRDGEWLSAEIAHQGDPEVVVALGFAVGACVQVAQREGATIEALVELDEGVLDEEQRAKVKWLLDALKQSVGRVAVAQPGALEEALRAAVVRQQN